MTGETKPRGPTPESFVPPSHRALWATVALSLLWLGIAGFFAWRFFGAGVSSLPPATPAAEGNAPLPPAPVLEVDSDPAGAAVFLNDRPLGASPLLVRGLKPGVYELRLERRSRRTACRRVRLKPRPTRQTCSFVLAPEDRGSVVVELKPAGAEVLLDGDLVGHTPLTLGDIPVGPHELLVRKTNFESRTTGFLLKAGAPTVFRGEALEDKILSSLTAMTETEPDNVAHWSDLGRYHFLNGRLDQAAAVFSKAFEVTATPLKFPDKPPLPEIERQTRLKLRGHNIVKMDKDLRQIHGWRNRNSADFEKKLFTALEKDAAKFGGNWNWVRSVAVMYTKFHDFDNAEKIYRRYIAAVMKGKPKKPPYLLKRAFWAIMQMRAQQRKTKGLDQLAAEYLRVCRPSAQELQQAGHVFYTAANRERNHRRKKNLLKLSENFLNRAVEAARRRKQKDVLALCLFEKGNVMVLLGNRAPAAEAYREAVKLTNQRQTKEQRSLPLAECLWALGREAEATDLYRKLAEAQHPQTRRAAQQALRRLHLPLPEKKKH